MTDALFRLTDPDRYDDRDIVQTNLVEGVDRLMAFGAKHLPDPFFLDEKAIRVSIRDIIVREMVVNMLIHREFTSTRRSRFVIEPGRMYTENPCRAIRQSVITPDNLEPDPKNPIVAAFFRTIGLADELGSGVRKMFKYGKAFAGNDPTLTEDDLFRSEFLLGSDIFKPNGNPNAPINAPINVPINVPIKGTLSERVLKVIAQYPGINRTQLANLLKVDIKTIGRAIAVLSSSVEHRGSKKTGGYYVRGG